MERAPFLSGSSSPLFPAETSMAIPPAYRDVAPEKEPNPVQSVMYAVPGPQPFSAFPRPSYPPPHSHLALAIITTIVCTLFNITSLGIGIPALILAIIAFVNIQKGQWKQAKTYSNASLYMSIANWIYTLGFALLALIPSMITLYYLLFTYCTGCCGGRNYEC